jgi:hypothetical protein
VVLAGVTPDLPTPDGALAADIIKRAAAGPARAEIVVGIQRRKIAARAAVAEEPLQDTPTELSSEGVMPA